MSPSSLVLRERGPTIGQSRLGSGGPWFLRLARGTADHCPRFPFDLVSVSTGAIRPGSCKAVRCPVCGPFEARRRAWRIASAGPERFLTLTALPAEYREALKVEQAFLRMVRRAGIEIEWAIAHELTKRGQRHGHALCKGDYLPQRSASRFAERAGMGRVLHIERIRDEGGTSYALKEALRVVGYTTKGTVASLGAHLDLNGGRICRTTRGYFTA